MRALLAMLLFTLAGCDCESRCDQDHHDCLNDGELEPIQCDVALSSCYDGCRAPLGAAPGDGG